MGEGGEYELLVRGSRRRDEENVAGVQKLLVRSVLLDRPPVRELGEVQVKGKAEPVKIFALGAKGESQPPFPVA